MPRAIWSGSISFGLVNVPVKLFTAVKDKEVRFHLLHAEDHARIQQKLVCRADGKEVPRDRVVKGYEFAPDQYVVISDEELEAIAPEATRTLDIIDFVDLADIDPIYYDRPYYVVPEQNAAKAYHLLARAMAETKKVAIARFVMHEKEYLAALRPSSGIILLETMRFADEVVALSTIEEQIPAAQVSERELTMAKQLIESLATHFEPERYHDTYRDRLMELIQRKVKGEEIVVAATPEEVPTVIDLVAALEASLEEAKRRRREQEATKKTA